MIIFIFILAVLGTILYKTLGRKMSNLNYTYFEFFFHMNYIRSFFLYFNMSFVCDIVLFGYHRVIFHFRVIYLLFGDENATSVPNYLLCVLYIK